MGTLTLTDPVNGTTADAALIANNNSAIKTVVNGGLDNTNIAAGAAIDPSKISGGVGSTPPGVIFPYAATAAPSGYLLCDGSAVSRATYAALFAVISTTYGSGDGSTTFNVPDARGRMIAGYAASGGHADVSTIGNSEGSAASARRPKHPHTNGVSISGAPGVGTLALPNHAHSITDPGHVHATLPLLASGNHVSAVAAVAAQDGDTETGEPNSGTATTGISVGNPTSLPAVTGAPSIGSLAIGGTVGASGTATDSPAYLVLNYIIKT